MSRSYKKPVHPWTCRGCRSGQESYDKKLARRRLRSRNKQRLRQGSEDFLLLKEVSNVWDFAKDGKVKYLNYPWQLCKNEESLEKYMPPKWWYFRK